MSLTRHASAEVTVGHTPSNVALGSAEAEPHAMAAGAVECLGAYAMLADYGCSIGITLHVSARAAIGVGQRKGLSNLLQLHTQALWIQYAVRKRQVQLLNVPASEDPADLTIKHLDGQGLAQIVTQMGFNDVAGRSVVAPKFVVNNVDEQESLADIRSSCWRACDLG